MNNETNTNENKNLLSRLRMKFHTAKICKALATLTIATAVALGAVSCANNNANSNSSDSNQAQSSQQNNQNNQNNIFGNNNTNNQNNNTQTNEYSKYSKLLQNVMNNQEYTSLINSAKSNPSLYESGEFKGVPYSFLESEGYDVTPFKNNTLKSYAYAFELEDEQNTLYMMVRAETNSAEPYYTEYLLKFKLTEQEMDDYHMLHSGNYIQACFLNNELAKLKAPQILHETRITIEAHNNLYSTLKRYSSVPKHLGGKKLGAISLLSINQEAGTFDLLIVSPISSGSMQYGGTINSIKLIEWAKDIKINSDNAFYCPSNENEFLFPVQENETCANVTFYSNNIAEKNRTEVFTIEE